LAPRNLKSFLVVGEKKIFHEITEIINLAAKSNAIMTDLIGKQYTVEKLTEAIQTITSLEKESDEIAFRVSEDITGGAVSPNIIDELLESIQHADNILDQYHNLSREFGRISKVAIKSFLRDREWNALFVDILRLAGRAFSKLKSMLSTSDTNEIFKMRREIETLEEKGDDIKDTGFDKLYTAAPKMHYLQFYHYSQVLHTCDNILDECEDLSDLIVTVVTSILK
jgi:predicted phosphate transport protein (TIGR00153 family)